MAAPKTPSPLSSTSPSEGDTAALRQEVQALRRTQVQMFKFLVSMRHEISHRQATGREEIGAFIKASHVELAERFDVLVSGIDEQQLRLLELEQDFDEVLDGPR